MRRSITWSPETWSDSRSEGSEGTPRPAASGDTPRPAPMRSPSPSRRIVRHRVSKDEFFHTPSHPRGHPRGILRRGGSRAPAADGVAPLVGSRSLEEFDLTGRRRGEDAPGVLPLQRRSPSLMFDATATHASEAPAEQRGAAEPSADEGPAPRWMRLLAPELVPLRRKERAFVLKRRAAMVLDTWIGGVSGISTTEQLLELSAGDVSTLAMHNAQIGSFINFPEMFLAPVFCAFSDQIGRVGAMTIGPLGLGLFWLAQTQLKSLNVRFWVYMLFRGCMRAGVTDIRESAFNDLFAAQPETYAILKASETVWANLGTLSSFGIALLVRRFIASNNACFFLSSALAALQAVVLASTEETLDKRDRKPINSIKSLLLSVRAIS